MTDEIKENSFSKHEYNVLMQALKNAAEHADQTMYDYMNKAPKTSFVSELMFEIETLGYGICKQAEQEELTQCPTCLCMTKKVCGKCKQDDIEKAVQAERESIVGEIEDMSYKRTKNFIGSSQDWILKNKVINLINNKYPSHQVGCEVTNKDYDK